MAHAPDSSLRAGRYAGHLPSITADMARQGYDPPSDLIGAMVRDTEQSGGHSHPPAGYYGKSATAAATPIPSLGEGSPDLPRLRADSSTLKRVHWQRLDKAVKCANRGCRVKFTRKVKRRNCSMCGDVFCHGCTLFRRKLSQNAEPDPLGAYFYVCKACCDTQTEAPRMRDHSAAFKSLRINHLVSMNQHYEKERMREKDKPLSTRTDAGKKLAIRDQAQLLAQGFHDNSGLVRDFINGVKIPRWQKCPQWVPTSRAGQCFACKTAFKVLSRKVHCHICGQVFCCPCTPDELLIYIDKQSNEAKWAVNAKEGLGPEVRPDRFELLRICRHCSGELEKILLDGLPANPATRIPVKSTPSEMVPAVVENVFLETLFLLQKKLMSLQCDVEQFLPRFLHLVDSLDIEDSSPHSVTGKHPMKELVLMLTNLSDGLSQLALKSQLLKQLRPATDLEMKLLRHVMIGTYQFYSENMYIFRTSKERLANLIPVDHHEELQSLINVETMENVHGAVHQLMYELLHLHKKHKYDDSFNEYIFDLWSEVEDEFKAFVERKHMNWDEHKERLAEITEARIKENKRMIVVSSTLSPSAARYAVISTCTTRLQKLSRELEAKTNVMVFTKTKECLSRVFRELERELSLHNATPHQL